MVISSELISGDWRSTIKSTFSSYPTHDFSQPWVPFSKLCLLPRNLHLFVASNLPKSLTSSSVLKMNSLKWDKSILLFVFFFFQLLAMVVSLGNDYEILLRVKNFQLDDPNGSLQDWVPNSEKNPCSWSGVACDSPNNSVVSIDLSSLDIGGGFPFDFCRISTLRNLSLANNYINGSLLSRSLTLCSNLRLLNLTSNLLVGELPEFWPGFDELLILDLSSNNFTGDIPASFGRLPELRGLFLSQNLLSGSIPSFLCNLTKLIRLELAYNPSMAGPLPLDIGNLTKLENLFLSLTNLVGTIPDSIGKLLLLQNLDLSKNSLSGAIPYSIGGLLSLVQMELFDNQLSGELPASLGNLTSLLRIDLSQNNLTGKFPDNLAGLPLESLNLNDNFLIGEIPLSLASSPNLVQLKLFNNSFSGHLPEYLGRNSDLEDFDVSTNRFSGGLPKYLCYRKKLQRLITFSNGFSGSLPESYGDCSSLYYVRIENNQLSGKIPASFWSFSGLENLQLENNRFEGPLSPAISGARELTAFLISGNNFSGDLPPEICQLGKLARLDVSRNSFSGDLPSCITELKKLQTLDMQENKFSGEIPKTVVSWQELAELNLSNNRLTGEIPAQLGDLPSLTYLDLSENLLTGEIPSELTKLKLNKFNLTGNRLSGEVPSGFNDELYLPSLMGNPGLCSPDLNPLPLCPKSKPASFYIVIVLSILAFFLVGSLMWVLKSKWRVFAGRSKSSWKVTSFQRVGFNEEDIIRNLTTQNLIGEGGSGRVYKVKLKTGQTVAVKRLWGGNKEADNESVFKSELETLGRIRHGNIVKLLLGCSSVDGDHILVFEYMENGSLGDALHGEKGGAFLDWPTRSSIAVGAAQGLAYLHHDCDPAIVHRDVKSNNILLDEEFVPRVADFGLAKTLQRKVGDGGGVGPMSRVAGSYGYIAPEYGYTMKVNEKSDVYSFGVLLMELVTGKRPNDAFFGESKDMVKWVTEAASSSSSSSSSSFSEEEEEGRHGRNLNQIIDPKLEESSCNYEEIEKVINVALLCTSALPINRPSMRKVVEMLKDQKRNLVPNDERNVKN